MEEEVIIPIEKGEIVGILAIPESATGIVLFAHGSGSGRFSPRNRQVARTLQEANLATLLMDLLSEAEETVDRRTRHLRFDIPLLAGRLAQAADWLKGSEKSRNLPIGLFGSSTGAAAALIAAAERPEDVSAVVSRGGRPDLASDYLDRVQAPTLLIVGGEDYPVIEMNSDALKSLRCEKRLEIVPGASHLFEEPGKLEEVSRLAAEWFGRHLT